MRNCSNTVRHRGVSSRLIFSVARLYMLVIPDYISKYIRSGDASVCFTSTYIFLSRATECYADDPASSPFAVWGEDTPAASFRFTGSSSSRLLLKLQAPHGSPYDIPVSPVYCFCPIGIGHCPSSVRVHNNNLQCQSRPSVPLPPTSLGSFSVPLKCVYTVPKDAISIPAFYPSALALSSRLSVLEMCPFSLVRE